MASSTEPKRRPMTELSPEERMQRRYPQPVRVGDLIGLPVLDELGIEPEERLRGVPEGPVDRLPIGDPRTLADHEDDQTSARGLGAIFGMLTRYPDHFESAWLREHVLIPVLMEEWEALRAQPFDAVWAANKE